jgi:polyisoprenoid-binding protein YceI
MCTAFMNSVPAYSHRNTKPMKPFVLSLLLFGPLPGWAGVKLAIDSSHSAVTFSWSHFGFSNPVARLENISGNLFLDETDLTKSSVIVTLPVAALRTGDDFLDKRLKTREFLDAARYPNITFRSTGIERAGPTGLRVTGDLYVHGITKPVVLDAKINKIGANPISKAMTAGFDADVLLRRSDFGVTKYVPAVTDEILVHITLDAHLGE